jgi:hypothetical protein
MLRRKVPTMSGKMIVILHVSVSEEVEYIYSIGKYRQEILERI